MEDLDPNNETRKVRMEDGILLPKYRLPTEAEWEYAALSLIGNSVDERIYERRIYPWNGHHTRNPDGAERGKMMANFVRGRGDMMGVAGALNDNADITAPVLSYWPNDFGLYCMAGNVNEWVQDVYRPTSFDDVDEFRPFRGNVFQTLERDEEGNVAEKDSLGRLRYRDITEAEAFGRTNYRRADNKNYLDGDKSSSLLYRNEESGDAPGSDRMYQQGPSIDRGEWFSLINDNSRVYKGGSWKDRAYWLAPGSRRYLDQESSTNDLGFRCAMIRVGSPSGF
jgi:formylglycine-generating enzyme